MSDETINTGGGAYIKGTVYTGCGDFIGRDQINIYNQAPSEPEEEEPWLPDLFPASRRLIGHRQEYERLCKLYDNITQKKRGQVVFITGRPGYGRRALAYALARYAEAKAGAVLGVRFLPTSRATIEQVEAIWADDPHLAAVPNEYVQRLEKFWPRAIRLAGTPWLTLMAQAAHKLGFVPSPSEQNVQDDPLALCAVLRRLVRKRPIILLLENLDYSESLWIDLVKYMTGEISLDLPILIVVTAQASKPLDQLPQERYTEVHHLAYTLAKQGQAAVLWLDRVTGADATAYIGPAQPELAARLCDLAEGVPAVMESLWSQWQNHKAVTRSPDGQWQPASRNETWVFGEARDQIYAWFKNNLVEEWPFEAETVEEMLKCAALEGLTFTAQAVARVFEVDPDELIDFFDEYLLEDEETAGLLLESGFVEITAGPGQRCLNLYRFAYRYVWHVWRSRYIDPLSRAELQRSLADALEIVYHPDTDKIADTLLPLLEATGQEERARPYRQRRQLVLDAETLKWQIIVLEQTAVDKFDQYRLFDLYLELSSRLCDASQYRDGYIQARKGLALVETLSDELREARALNLSGMNLQAQGEYVAAQPLYEQALAICEQGLGPDHPDTATSLNNLARLLQDQGEYAAAQPLYEQALAICEQGLGPDHPDTATSLNNLAWLLQAQGEYAAAQPLVERALAIREQELGPDHPDTATSLDNLARLLQDQGEYAAAQPLFQRALAIYEKGLGPDHPHTAQSLNNLAELLQDQGEYAAAQPLYEQALAIYEKGLGPDHPHTATSLNNLAGLLQAQGEYAAAQPLFQRALAIYEKGLGPDHPHTATSLNNLARLLQAQGEYAAAQPLVERALAIYEKGLGPDHPHTAQSLNNLAGLLQDQGEYAAAQPLFERALAIREQGLGPDHPHTATSLNNLARLLQDQGEYAAAQPLFERALAIREQGLGPDHPDSWRVRENLASLKDALK